MMRSDASAAAGAVSSSSSKPWEGPLIILDGQLGQPKSGCCGTADRLLPDPVTAQQAVQQIAASLDDDASSATGNWQHPNAAGTAGGVSEAVTDLEQLVQQLQQQLRESQQLAQQWKSLHTELHQFCIETLMAATAVLLMQPKAYCNSQQTVYHMLRCCGQIGMCMKAQVHSEGWQVNASKHASRTNYDRLLIVYSHSPLIDNCFQNAIHASCLH